MSTKSDQWHLDCYQKYLSGKYARKSNEKNYSNWSNFGSTQSSSENLHAFSSTTASSSKLTKVQKYQTLNISENGQFELDVEEEDDLMMLLDGIASI